MDSPTFRKQYKNLNKRQREAVDAIQGPVMVIAGPGTGKTSILTLRIANILQKTDTPPDAILALTFTESGAYSMRRKLVEIIGGAAYRVGIFTFHGFANHIIKRYQESFPRIVGSRSATSADQARILEEIFLRSRFKLIRPFGDIFYYVPKALRAIQNLKRENISHGEFKKALSTEVKRIKSSPERFHDKGRFKGELRAIYRDRLRKIEKSRELATVYELYGAKLSRERLFDFEDMLLETIRALEKDRDLLLTLQEQYHYILADEHQDANSAQNRILELLSSFDDVPNLFMVGDEKQAIYRFQGASLENFLYFKKRFPQALLVNLKENYRSTQMILDASHSLMKNGNISSELPENVLRPRLLGQTSGGKKNLRFFEFGSTPTEIAFVVGDIEERLRSGAFPREIAVLFRDNEDALPLVLALEKTTIPFSVFSDEDILRDQELGKLLLILRAVSEPGNPSLFAEMLHLDFLGVPPVTLYELLRFCHTNRVSLFDVLQSRILQKKARIGEKERIPALFNDFSRWARLAKNASAGETVETIARESGFVRTLFSARGSLRALEKLDALFSHLKELSANQRAFQLRDFLEILERLQKHGMRLSGKGVRPEFYDSISLLTAHRAKGLEFSYVYIINAIDGHWGGRRGREDFYIPLFLNVVSDMAEDFKSLLPKTAVPLLEKGELAEDEDERRLFYVALTRARKEVIITMSRESTGGRQALPSQFVEDIPQVFLSREDTVAIEKRLRKHTPFYLKERINVGPSVTLKEYLQKVFLEQGLTVTALNNYLSCPWEYFFKNLVRLPQIPAPYLSYGNAMHDALNRFFDRYRESARVGKKELLRFFDRSLLKSPLPLREFGEYKRRGRFALSGYVDLRHDSFTRDTNNEYEITGVFLPLQKGIKLLLRGKLDKIERNSDGTVTVVDYKTGKPKSRTEILGTTKGGNGNMKRQLDFYKLLLSPRLNHESWRRADFGEMKTGVIDFLEPDAKGNYHQEVFEITERDATAVAEEAIRVGKDIYNLAFWDKRCRDRKCEYCRLRDSIAGMKPRRKS